MSYQGRGPKYEEIEMANVRGPGGTDSALDGDSKISGSGSTASKYLKYALGAALLVVAATTFEVMLKSKGDIAPISAPSSAETALFDDSGRYVMRNYDDLKPMSNFLAGLGGFWGLPMWAFYVNRGQGVTAFGVQNKDGGIAKFNTAEKAYQQTPFTGFRTFVKGSRGGKQFAHMPFFPNGFMAEDEKPVRNMMIGMNEVEIEETATAIGLQTNVLYFTIPEEDFPSMVRRTTFTNLDTTNPLTLDVLDGLAKLIPAGLPNWNLDAMGRTMEAWMNVYNIESLDASSEESSSDESKVEVFREPFFHISQGTGDTAQVQIIKDGYFVVAYIEEGDDVTLTSDGLHAPLEFVVDPSVVFETDTTLTNPSGFFREGGPDGDAVSKLPQGTTSRTPCSFAAAKLTIAPGASVTVTSIYGHAENLETFVGKVSPQLRVEGYVAKKREVAQSLVDAITKRVNTTTSSSLFDAYVAQDFLDNTLRGGLPVVLGDASDPKIYHTFSRIHGDLERDYNNFQIDTTYFSQGPGNFRDVNQNRRLDVLLQPKVGDFNVRMFLSFVQADGYNPLTVATTNLKVPFSLVPALVLKLGIIDPPELQGKYKELMTNLLKRPFRIGQLFKDMKIQGIETTSDRMDFLNKIMAAANQVFAAQYAQNGFWADHWTYTLDLVENYLAVYPDKEQTLLYNSEPLPFFMSPAIVKSRADRYTLVPGWPQSIRVYGAVSASGDKDYPPERASALSAIYSDPDYVADPGGAGGVWQRTKSGTVYTVSVVAKLAMLGLLKFSTLDPMGMGVEMEGGKPGWNDAMNGLPGIIGSGMPETYEMLRIIRYVKASLTKYGKAVTFPKEFAEFMTGMSAALTAYSKSAKDPAAEHTYWDASNNAREKYRADVVATFSGLTVTLPTNYLITLLGAAELKTTDGITRALATNGGLSPSYFFYDCVTIATITPKDGTTPTTAKVECKEFKTRTLPQFLEGPTRHMKVVTDKATRQDVFERTKASDIYDQALKMFKLSESLETMGQDVGRMKAFSPGWLENQSVWLHMSYKFYLELLRGGLYTEFFEEIKTGLVPFMDNAVYGRSPLEAASFIVSSAFPDKKLHGASFLARLSGSTAEFLSMWSIMMTGAKPFAVDSAGELQLKLAPVLPGWMFTEEGTVSFTFLGEVAVTYHNPAKVDTWTASPKTTSIVYLGGATFDSEDGVLRGEVAESVRNLQVQTIDVYY